MSSNDLRARGDRDLAERLLREPGIRAAVERYEKEISRHGARRELLATAMRLTPEMTPDVHAIMEDCRAALGIDLPVETYVYPTPLFNAAAVRPERGMLFVMLSSSMLEAFEPGELKFVVGHELGHHLFEHHRIPLAPLLNGTVPVGAGLALQFFAWQRYAEISSDLVPYRVGRAQNYSFCSRETYSASAKIRVRTCDSRSYGTSKYVSSAA